MAISRKYDDTPMPYFLHVKKNVGIHGRVGIDGGQRSHGCIGIPYLFSHILYQQVSVGKAYAYIYTKQVIQTNPIVQAKDTSSMPHKQLPKSPLPPELALATPQKSI
jgi:hypothetical protein